MAQVKSDILGVEKPAQITQKTRHVARGSFIQEDLTNLSATEKVLFRGKDQMANPILTTNEYARERIVEKTLVEKCNAVCIASKYMLGNKVRTVIFNV